MARTLRSSRGRGRRTGTASSQVPRWGDGCPNPPGATGDGCVVTGRLSRFTAGGSEQVLIEDWCQQYPSHTVGSLAFGPEGELYVSAGEGAHFNLGDFGQLGGNPCGDPPGPGAARTSPTAEGGSLRSQDVRTAGDATGLGGTVIRVNPDTGAALPDNPNATSSDPTHAGSSATASAIRSASPSGPARTRSGSATWAGSTRRRSTGSPTPCRCENFGWPCYEGAGADNGWAGSA